MPYCVVKIILFESQIRLGTDWRLVIAFSSLRYHFWKYIIHHMIDRTPRVFCTIKYFAVQVYLFNDMFGLTLNLILMPVTEMVAGFFFRHLATILMQLPGSFFSNGSSFEALSHVKWFLEIKNLRAVRWNIYK